MKFRYAAALPVILSVLLAGCVAGPAYQPQPAPAPTVYPTQPPPPRVSVYEEIRLCRADNQRAHTEVLDNYERARRAGRISPSEAQEFNAMDAQLRNVAFQLGRDGLNLPECQYISSELARMRDALYRMSRRDPALARCMADNRWAHQDVTEMYESARRNGQIHPGEAQRFRTMEARLQNLRSELARDGISYQDCQRIGGTIARERDEVIRMVRYEPTAAGCMADNRRAHWMVYEVYNDGVRAGRIDSREGQRFREVDERLKRFQTMIKRDGVSLDECQRVSRAIAQERAIVDSMIRN